MPYHRLDVYQKAYALVLEVHRMSLEFPKLEQYGWRNNCGQRANPLR